MTDTNWSEHCCYRKDPCEDIKPALLNSADIKRYMDKGCLIEEGSFELKRLKPASYEMRFLGKLYDWHWQEADGKFQQRIRDVCDDEYVTLDKNSISYLWTDERLLLPEYIAARFNLHIRHVHKGILLGTGPLIDPGFGGRILIPLHNLTDNDYELRGGEGIIWVEFTKVSKNKYWLSNGNDSGRPPGLVEFPRGKIINDPRKYLKKADVPLVQGVQSAFKGALKQTRRDADNAVEKVLQFESRFKAWGIGGVIGGALSMIALLISAYQLSFPVMEKIHSQSDRIGELKVMLEDLEDKVEAQSSGPGVSMNEPFIETEETTSVEAQPVDTADNPLEPEIPTPLTR